MFALFSVAVFFQALSKNFSGKDGSVPHVEAVHCKFDSFHSTDQDFPHDQMVRFRLRSVAEMIKLKVSASPNLSAPNPINLIQI